MIDDKARIEHMIEHIRRIQTMLQEVSEEQFYQSFALVDGVSFNFAIMGEAANKVSAEVRGRHTDIPWGSIIGMRNFLIHDYSKAKPKYLWEAVQNDLPPLLLKLEDVVKRL